MKEYTVAGEKIQQIYNNLNKDRKNQFGKYKKCVFHLHTPASHDYALVQRLKDKYSFQELSEQEILDILVKKMNIPGKDIDLSKIKYDKQIFENLKEYLAYYLVAAQLFVCQIEIVVVTDHNTISGYNKLAKVVEEHWKTKRAKHYPEIVCGIEISCADNNHVVGIFENNQLLRKKITEWLDEYVMSPDEGTYRTSVDVLRQIDAWGGIGYIAHIDTRNTFKDKYLNHAYKKTLFSLNFMNAIGVSNRDMIPSTKERVARYTDREYCYIVDEDSHFIEEIGTKAVWLKGVTSDFGTIKKAIRDYNISVELYEPKEVSAYIKGLYVKRKKDSFLSGKNGQGDFFITFSSELNCFIGGRGVGKSTVLQIIDFVLGQNYISRNTLEVICAYDELWILYSFKGKDYLVLFNVPMGTFDSTQSAADILTSEFRRARLLGGKEEYERIQKKYIQIFRVRENKTVLEQKEINGVPELLALFFDTKYSVNELVQIASTEEISEYVKSTIQKNNKIKKIRIPNYVRTLRGLALKLEDTKNIFYERKQEMQSIISEYNKLHGDDLQIAYYIKRGSAGDIDFNSIFLFMTKDKNKWFEKYNIRNENVIFYFQELLGLFGIIGFLENIINKNWKEFYKRLPIENYTEEQSFKTVNEGVIILNEKTVKSFFELVYRKFSNDKAIDVFSRSLRSYVENAEGFSLNFNINNKEDVMNAKPIFKPIAKLSMGQKVVAMLTFILSYSDFSQDYRPLVIDQPEDNLDNQYIYKNLVKQLREVKSKRQVIIATHSATIVTNAKAEQVIVMESDNEHGWIRKVGYPNDRQIIQHIINNLEGGKESFMHKTFIYEDVLKRDK